MKKKIMLMARDPGGANSIIPLVTALQSRDYQVCLYGKDMALHCYEQRGVAGQDIDLIIRDISAENWLDFLQIENPDFIITGTSGDDFSERYLWKAAEETGIMTFAILDQWINYGIRFSPYIPREQEQYQINRTHPYLPCRILVMDDWARQAMIDEGIEASRILISGQPHFDYLLSQKNKISSAQTNNFKREYGISEEDFLITYISQPLSRDYENARDYWGYDEQSICRHILNALYEVNKSAGTKISFIIKQHPREREGTYDCLNEEFNEELIKTEVLKNVDNGYLLMASDLVCGISSMLLLEAIIYNRPVISVQIGIKKKTPLVLAQRGMLQPIQEIETLKEVLQDIITVRPKSETKWQMESGAVDEVINYMEEFL